MSSELENAQRVLEQNEDILAAIVENLQLGRLNDCMQHYAILQANLVSLATHLDNFPAEESDPYTRLDIFPDEIMRKDLLEDLRPAGSKPLPKAPIIPPCAECLAKKNSAVMCRGTLKHIEPSGKYSAIEREEFYNITQVLSARPTPPKQDFTGSKRRPYKVWAPFEKYTLLVGISLFGTETSKLCQVLEDRNGEQIRNYITKKLKKADKWIVHFNAVDLMNHRPNGYQPPPLLAPYFAAHALGLDPETVQEDGFLPSVVTESADPTAAPAAESLLAPEVGKPDFNLMLAIAAGVSTHNPNELATRVPLLTEHTMEMSDEGLEEMDVEPYSGTSFPRTATTSVRPAMIYPNSSNASSSSSGVRGNNTVLSPTQHSQAGSRRVHWEETSSAGQRVSIDTADNADLNDDFTSYASYEPSEVPSNHPSSNNSNNTSSNTVGANNMNINLNMGASILPSLRDPSVVSALPPLPSGPPATLRDPLRNSNITGVPLGISSATGVPLSAAESLQAGNNMSYYAQQQLQVDAAKQAQLIQREEEIKLEKKRREESALLGLDAYNLEYARRLQAANIPFKMTSGSAVVVVKGDGIQTTTTTSNKNQPPPFARPGMQRMKKQQAAARQQVIQEQQELQHATAALPAPLQSSLLLQDPQQLVLQPQTTLQQPAQAPPLSMFAMHPLASMQPMQPMQSMSSMQAMSMQPMAMPHNSSFANMNNLNNLNNPNNTLNLPNNLNLPKAVPEKRHIHHMTAGVYSELPPGAPLYPIQPVSNSANPTMSFADESFAARLQEALRPRMNNSNNNINNVNKGKHSKKAGGSAGAQRQLLSQPIVLSGDQPVNSSSSSSNGGNSSSGNNNSTNNESTQPSLFHHILNGTNINPPNKSTNKHKSKHDDNNITTNTTTNTNTPHSSAALDVSMSGYEEEGNNSNLHAPPGMYSDQMLLATSDDLSGMQDFGCEFSFL